MEFKGKEKMSGARRMRGGLIAAAFLALAACDPVPQGDTRCESALACEMVKLVAADVRTDIGKNFGGGVVLRNAQTVGQSLVMDVSLPLSQAAFSEPLGKRIASNFGRDIARGFCSGPDAQRFFDLGALLRVRGFSSDNRLVADQVIRSCRGG